MAHSELECFVLGLIWQFGPIAAYGVRRQMQDSPSRQWSASTGAIYPVLRRLEEQGLVVGQELHQGKRRRREYLIAEKGLAVLRAWIGPPMGEDVVTVTFDPLRTRARFLAALAPGARLAWVEEGLRTLNLVEAAIRAWGERHDQGDAFLAATTRNALLETAARRRWLEEVRGIVRGGGPES
jgi:DNA-binding PadR family transcriptional regulator